MCAHTCAHTRRVADTARTRAAGSHVHTHGVHRSTPPSAVQGSWSLSAAYAVGATASRKYRTMDRTPSRYPASASFTFASWTCPKSMMCTDGSLRPQPHLEPAAAHRTRRDHAANRQVHRHIQQQAAHTATSHTHSNKPHTAKSTTITSGRTKNLCVLRTAGWTGQCKPRLAQPGNTDLACSSTVRRCR